MARKPSTESLREYDELKVFFAHWLTQVMPLEHVGLEHPSHPLKVLASFEKSLTFSQTISGLRQGVNDCLEQVEDWPVEAMRLADASLKEAGAPLLSSLLARRRKILQRILRRERVADETEYYLVLAALADTASDRPPHEVLHLEALAAAYAARA